MKLGLGKQNLGIKDADGTDVVRFWAKVLLHIGSWCPIKYHLWNMWRTYKTCIIFHRKNNLNIYIQTIF